MSAPDTPTPDELPVLLMRVAKAMFVQVTAAKAQKKGNPSGLTMVHAFAARYLNEHQGVTSAELAHHLGITRQSVSEVVTALEEPGYVQRRPHPTDGRAQVLELTDEGRDKLASSRSAWLQIERDWEALVGPDELAHVRAALDAWLAAAADGGDHG